MAVGGKPIDEKLFKIGASTDIDGFIKQIVIIQRSQITGRCPLGHSFCINADCWVVLNEKKGVKDG
jgi:UDP-3-O-[3-hydroxymyristoyl] glucosamine N-acyltransferase